MFHKAEECILYFEIISVTMVEIKSLLDQVLSRNFIQVELLLTDSKKIKITVLTFL